MLSLLRIYIRVCLLRNPITPYHVHCLEDDQGRLTSFHYSWQAVDKLHSWQQKHTVFSCSSSSFCCLPLILLAAFYQLASILSIFSCSPPILSAQFLFTDTYWVINSSHINWLCAVHWLSEKSWLVSVPIISQMKKLTSLRSRVSL